MFNNPASVGLDVPAGFEIVATSCLAISRGLPEIASARFGLKAKGDGYGVSQPSGSVGTFGRIET